jgi:hypothetical protein
MAHETRFLSATWNSHHALTPLQVRGGVILIGQETIRSEVFLGSFDQGPARAIALAKTGIASCRLWNSYERDTIIRHGGKQRRCGTGHDNPLGFL